jgi:hypothetical protein
MKKSIPVKVRFSLSDIPSGRMVTPQPSFFNGGSIYISPKKNPITAKGSAKMV